MSEFCPRCTSPLEVGPDPDRLCEVCGWFGDAAETLSAPPKPARINPVLAATQCLDLFRDVCRKELIAEQLFDAGHATESDINQIRLSRRQATDAIVELFATLHRRPHLPEASAPGASAKIRILRPANGMVAWPDGWLEHRHFNACNEPCDMLAGPCSCGAWHCESEPWVQEVLQKYNAEIVDG